MDAEHRHELKTNELAQWLSDFPELAKKNANIIIGVVLIAIGFLTWPMLNRMASEKGLTQQAETTNSIQMLETDIIKAVTDKSEDPQAKQQALSMLLVNADTLLEKAGELENPNLAAMARIKAAQTIRTELQLRREDVSVATVEAQIKKASDAYQKAFDGADDAQIKGLAKLGLGLCSEELGQTEQAAAIYQEILKNDAYAATIVPVQAQKRLDFLAEKSGSVYFAPAPVEVTETPAAQQPGAASSPSVQIAPATAPAETPAAEAAEIPAGTPAPAPEQPTVPAEQTPAPK